MKKNFIFILLLAIVAVLSGCEKDKAQIKVIVPNGTPLIAVAGVELDNVTIENVSGPSALTAAMTSKSHDIVIAPLTAGAKLFIKGASTYKLDSIITFSNIYMASTKKLDSLNDLEGKKVIGYGQGTTPGIILEKATEGINIDITYVASLSEATGYLVNTTDEFDYVLIAEPAITNLVEAKKLSLNILDLSKKLEDEIPLIPQAGIFVNPEGNTEAINEYLAKVKANITSLNDDPSSYAKKVVSKYEYLSEMTENIIALSIPKSNIDFKNASENKEALENFYSLLNDYNQEILTGVPDDGFYN